MLMTNKVMVAHLFKILGDIIRQVLAKFWSPLILGS